MCEFFSFVTEPEQHGGQRFYFDWTQRRERNLDDGCDSHSIICKHYKLDEDICNRYEYDPLTKKFEADRIRSEVDDRVQAHEWVEKLNWKRIFRPLIVKPIIHPFKDIPAVEQVTEEHIQWLKEYIKVRASVWYSIRASVKDSIRASIGGSVWYPVWNSARDSIWDSVRGSVRDSIWNSARDSAWDSIWNSARDSIWDLVWAYLASFVDVKYGRDFSSGAKLWESGLVPSFDGKTWRLHTGEDAHVVYEEALG